MNFTVQAYPCRSNANLLVPLMPTDARNSNTLSMSLSVLTASTRTVIFFQIEPYQAVELLKFIDKGATDLTQEVSEDITEDLTEADKEALETDEAKNKPRRPPLNFAEMKIPGGATLVYIKDNSVTCTVYTDRKVKFNDEVTSLTAITKKLLNTVHATQPTPHWEYNGRNLQDIYDETYPFIEE